MSGNKLFKHLGDRYEVLSGYETVRLINKTLVDNGSELTEGQKQILYRAFGGSGICGNLDMPFLAYSWKDNWKESNYANKFNVWRLTFPFFAICIALAIILYLPVKWIFTGHFGFEQKSRAATFFVNWRNKIWPNRHW